MHVTIKDQYTQQEYCKILTAYAVLYDANTKEFILPSQEQPFTIGTVQSALGPPMSPIKLFLARINRRLHQKDVCYISTPSYKKLRLSFERSPTSQSIKNINLTFTTQHCC